ncbi:MAG TPA: hypothetical protein VH417_08965 [Vicinamibacterales bacterium]
MVVRTGLAAATAAALACGTSPITSSRVERAVGRTFANLVPLQLARLDLPAVDRAALKVIASCYRPAGGGAGSGGWVCTVIWSGENGVLLRDTYDVTVTPDGCYTAAVDPIEGQVGGSITRTQRGQDVRNLLYAFEGCFDTTSPSS